MREFKCGAGLEFSDISEEDSRSYEFVDKIVTIDNPQYLRVSSSGGHYIFDGNGVSHYIPVGLVHLSWVVTEGNHFSF